MICPNCGRERPDYGFCPNCGAPLPMYSGGTVPGLKYRNILVCILLSIITCGIYGLYWIYVMNDDTNTLGGESDAFGGVAVILLSIITCNIYLWYWLYKRGKLLENAARRYGRQPDSNMGIVYLVLGVIGLNVVSYALIQNEVNRYAPRV